MRERARALGRVILKSETFYLYCVIQIDGPPSPPQRSHLEQPRQIRLLLLLPPSPIPYSYPLIRPPHILPAIPPWPRRLNAQASPAVHGP